MNYVFLEKLISFGFFNGRKMIGHLGIFFGEKMEDPHISVSEVTKNTRGDKYPKVKPEHVESHFMKRSKLKPSPRRDISDPGSDIFDFLGGLIFIIDIIDDNDPFTWNGSYLGRIGNHNILEQVNYAGVKYWRIRILGHIKICIVRSIVNLTPCVTDELKEIFSLPKLGTNHVVYHTKMYLLMKARLDQRGRIIEEITIDKVDPNKNKDFVERVQEVFVFREILGLIMSREKSVTVRWSDKSYIPPYPISFYESEMRPNEDNPVISLAVEKNWFGDVGFDDVLRKMLRIKTNEDVSEKISFLRSRITSVIERIDRDMIWLINPIMAKITRRLLIDEEKIGATPEWD